MEFSNLRDANIARQREWDTGNQMTLSYSGNELAGEVGEAIEAVCDYLSSGDRLDMVRDELGDVVICCDLLAMRFGLDLVDYSVVPDPGVIYTTGLDETLLALAVTTGKACNAVKKLEREALGMKGSRSTPFHLNMHLDAIIDNAWSIAAAFGVTLSTVVADKFNATSKKVGLNTRLVA